MCTLQKTTNCFFTPDYFHDFCCKMGDCRHACCQGWPVTISMQNYFKLLGIDCPKDLRERIDRSLIMNDRPTEDEYARLSHNYEGNCTIRMEDGRCPIHANLGEDALPDICRLYPRGFRLDEGKYEVSLSNSCEAVVEIFYSKKEPISFFESKMTVALPKLGKRHSYFETLGRSREIRMFLIEILQNRLFSLPERVLQLGRALDRLEKILVQKDEFALEEFLNLKLIKYTDKPLPLAEQDLKIGLTIAKTAVNILDSHSSSIRDYGLKALSYFESSPNVLSLYHDAKDTLKATFPDLDIFLEHLLVNHMFFSLFPFQDRPDSLKKEFITLCSVYTLMRFLILGNCGKSFDKIVIIDTVAAFFRHVSHTDFERVASRLLYDCGCTNPDSVEKLLNL